MLAGIKLAIKFKPMQSKIILNATGKLSEAIVVTPTRFPKIVLRIKLIIKVAINAIIAETAPIIHASTRKMFATSFFLPPSERCPLWLFRYYGSSQPWSFLRLCKASLKWQRRYAHRHNRFPWFSWSVSFPHRFGILSKNKA